MARFLTPFAFCFALALLLGAGCLLSTDSETIVHDPQFVEIYLQHGFLDELNTFGGTLTKDLVMDGSITVAFWLSTEEQQTILERAEQMSFFSLPDTFPAEAGVSINPDPSPDKLRIRSGNRDHTVVWSYPRDPGDTLSAIPRQLSEFIFSIVRQTPTYKALPQPRGGWI
jgi:hypothetical protein